MNILTIQNLSKSFGKQKIIDGLSMSVPEGSVFGFIGKNGAGKTTTMKMVLGLLQPDSGSIFVCNEPVRFGQTKTNQYIGYLPDVPELSLIHICPAIQAACHDGKRTVSALTCFFTKTLRILQEFSERSPAHGFHNPLIISRSFLFVSVRAVLLQAVGQIPAGDNYGPSAQLLRCLLYQQPGPVMFGKGQALSLIHISNIK